MQNIKKGFIKNIVSVLLAVTLAFPITLFAGCGLKSSDYTEKEHLKRVSERVEKRYFADDGKYEYTDYEVYPLYDENDQLTHFLVEFEPYGYLYVILYEEDASWFPGGNGMYGRSYGDWEIWSRYTISEDSTDLTEKIKTYERDETGNIMEYNVSHFKAANIKDENRYLLNTHWGWMPAVKRGDEFLNLISMQEMVYSSEARVSVASISFIYKAQFNL